MSFKQQQTQIFIETPFRNNYMLEDLCKYCQAHTELVVATNINTESESITETALKIGEKDLDLNKKPNCFFFNS